MTEKTIRAERFARAGLDPKPAAFMLADLPSQILRLTMDDIEAASSDAMVSMEDQWVAVVFDRAQPEEDCTVCAAGAVMVERGLIEGRYERARANAAAAVGGPLADVHKWTPAEVETDMLERLETVMPREEALEEANAVAEKLYAIDELRNGDVFRGAARIHAATTGKPFERKTTARLLDAEKQLHEINDENRILYQKARDAQDAALVNGGNDAPEDGPPFNTFAWNGSNEVNTGVAWFRQFVIPALERLQL